MFYVLLAVAAVITAAGFYKFVYFLSTGYAFSVAGLAVAMMIGFGTSLTLPVVILLAIIALYAARLGVFLVIREYKNGAYRKVLDEASSGYKKIPFFVKIVIWIFCSILYVMQVSPVFFRLQNGLQEAHTGWLYVGIVLVAAGFLIADCCRCAEKQGEKRKPQNFLQPGTFQDCTLSQLFRRNSCLDRSLCVIHALFIRMVPDCLFACRIHRHSLRHVRFNPQAGTPPEQELRIRPRISGVCQNTPVLIPLIPLYSVAEWKWIFG